MAGASGGTLTGTQSALGDTVEIYDGTVDGDKIHWKVDIKKPLALTIECTATIDGDAISGEAKAGVFPTAHFSGMRVG